MNKTFIPADRKQISVALSGNFMSQVTSKRGGRYYEVDGDRYQSVTSLISGTLRNFGVERWKDGWIKDQLQRYEGETLTPSLATKIVTASDNELTQSAELGTHMHDIIERLLRDEDVNDYMDDQYEPAVRAWLKWRARFIEWQLVGTEVGVYCDGASRFDGFAGQVDALFKLGNDYMVVDWKTSSGLYDSSFLQVGAYAHALRDMYAIHPDTQVTFGGFSQGSKVKACVVRLVNDYPKIEGTGKKNRRVKKRFNGDCEYALIDVDHWYQTFAHMVATKSGTKAKVEKIKL